MAENRKTFNISSSQPGEVKIADEVTDILCEECGRNMVIKYGPHGKFLACPGFPECKNTKPYFEKIGVECPKCGKELVVRKTKKGRKSLFCSKCPRAVAEDFVFKIFCGNIQKDRAYTIVIYGYKDNIALFYKG